MYQPATAIRRRGHRTPRCSKATTLRNSQGNFSSWASTSRYWPILRILGIKRVPYVLLSHELHGRAQTKRGETASGPEVTQTNWRAWEASFNNTLEEELLVGAGTTRRPLGRLGLTNESLVEAAGIEPANDAYRTVTATRPVALRRSVRTEKRTGLDSEREASAQGNIPMSGCFGQTRGLHKVAITYSRQSPKLEGVRAPWEGRVRG
jgi:hypothetical protein